VTTKVTHFEGAVGFAMLIVPAFVGLGMFYMVDGLLPTDMNPKGAAIIAGDSGLVAAALMVAMIRCISSFARHTPVPVESDEGEQR
jgi:hypothetical protein